MSYDAIKWTAVVVCAVASAVLAWRKTEGWGWFLLVAFVLAGMSA